MVIILTEFPAVGDADKMTTSGGADKMTVKMLLYVHTPLPCVRVALTAPLSVRVNDFVTPRLHHHQEISFE